MLYEECIKLSKDEETPWCCPKCVAETLPFNCTSDNDLFIEKLRLTNKVSEDLNLNFLHHISPNLQDLYLEL